MSKIGDRRPFAKRMQVCLGPCVVCGGPVWRYEDEPRADAPPVHKRLCADRFALKRDQGASNVAEPWRVKRAQDAASNVAPSSESRASEDRP